MYREIWTDGEKKKIKVYKTEFYYWISKMEMNQFMSGAVGFKI